MDQKQVCACVMRCLNRLRLAEKFCDITLLVSDVPIPAHKAVLAGTSKFFHQVLNTDKATDLFQINGILPTDMVKILDFIYTGQIVVNKNNVSWIDALAQQLQIDILSEFCSVFKSQHQQKKSNTNEDPSADGASRTRTYTRWGKSHTISDTISELEDSDDEVIIVHNCQKSVVKALPDDDFNLSGITHGECAESRVKSDQNLKPVAREPPRKCRGTSQEPRVFRKEQRKMDGEPVEDSVTLISSDRDETEKVVTTCEVLTMSTLPVTISDYENTVFTENTIQMPLGKDGLPLEFIMQEVSQTIEPSTVSIYQQDDLMVTSITDPTPAAANHVALVSDMTSTDEDLTAVSGIQNVLSSFNPGEAVVIATCEEAGKEVPITIQLSSDLDLSVSGPQLQLQSQEFNEDQEPHSGTLGENLGSIECHLSQSQVIEDLQPVDISGISNPDEAGFHDYCLITNPPKLLAQNASHAEAGGETVTYIENTSAEVPDRVMSGSHLGQLPTNCEGDAHSERESCLEIQPVHVHEQPNLQTDDNRKGVEDTLVLEELATHVSLTTDMHSKTPVVIETVETESSQYQTIEAQDFQFKKNENEDSQLQIIATENSQLWTTKNGGPQQEIQTGASQTECLNSDSQVQGIQIGGSQTENVNSDIDIGVQAMSTDVAWNDTHIIIIQEPDAEIKDIQPSSKATKSSSACRAQCPWCSANFANASQRGQHAKLTHRSLLYTCSFCSRLFVEEEKRDNHTDWCRVGCKVDGRYRCPQCSYSAAKALFVVNHYRLKHTTRCQRSCELCTQTFNALPDYYDHMLQVHKSNVMQESKRKVYTCTECNFQTVKPYAIKSHLTNHKSDLFACKSCQKNFKTVLTLRRHEKLVHGSTFSKCSQCEFSSKYTATLKAHEYRVHKMSSATQTIYYCQYCDYNHIDRANISKHECCKHSDERSFLCSYCPKAFKQRHQVTIHERTHTGARPFSCIQCAYTARSRVALKTHQMYQHSAKTDKPYRCELCEFATKGASNLLHHKKTCSKRNDVINVRQ